MDRNDVRRMRLLADSLKLIGREFLHMPRHIVIANCNGIGPDFFPKKWRKFITKYNPSLKVSAAIHDMMYAYGYDFAKANDILAINGKWEAEAMYAWYNPVRYFAIWRAKKFASLCQRYGYPAWKAAQRKVKR